MCPKKKLVYPIVDTRVVLASAAMESPLDKRKRIVQKLLCKRVQDQSLYNILWNREETQDYILSGTWRDTKLAPTRATEQILLQSDEWTQEDRRKRDLIAALRTKGLGLRDDSALCRDYILYGLGKLHEIVYTMIEMNWFHTQTNYKAILDDLYNIDREEFFECDSDFDIFEREYRGMEREHYEPIDSVEMSENAKRIVLEAMSLTDTKMPTVRLQFEVEKIKERNWIQSTRANWYSIYDGRNNVLPAVLIDILGNYLGIISRHKKRTFSSMNAPSKNINAKYSEDHCSGCYQRNPARACTFHLCGICCTPENNCPRHHKNQ